MHLFNKYQLLQWNLSPTSVPIGTDDVERSCAKSEAIIVPTDQPLY